MRGHESIFCEGVCQGWMHRTCIGLSKKAFQSTKESPEPCLCHYCSSVAQQSEIQQLKATVSALQAEIESLKCNSSSPETTNYSDDNQDAATYASIVNSGQSILTPVLTIPKSILAPNTDRS